MVLKGTISRVLEFLRAERNGAKQDDIKVDTGGGANKTALGFQPTGTDSQPLPEDYNVCLPTTQTGRLASVGFADPTSEPKANAGDVRHYSRDAEGTTLVETWLKNDGTFVVSNYRTGEGEDAEPILLTTYEIAPDGATTLTVTDGETEKARVEALADGTVRSKNEVVTTELLPDGTAKTINENGSNTLNPDGSHVVTTPSGDNTFATDGSVTFSNGSTSTSDGDFVTAIGVTLNGHKHIGNLGSPTSIPII